MARISIQEYILVSDLVAETQLPKSNDFVYVQETGRLYNFVQGSVLSSNGNTIISQTSASGLGRWESVTASAQKLIGSVTFPALGNACSMIVTATMAVGTLPIGTPAHSNISNGDVCYTAGSAIPSDVYIGQGMVVAPDKVAFFIMNNTGGNIDSFTANIIVSKL